MELMNPGLEQTLTAPLSQTGEATARAPRVALDEATIDRELSRYAGALGGSLTLTMMFSAALLIGAGVAAQWAVPGFDQLPTTLAVGCLFSALGLSLSARARFRAQVARCGVALGLDDAEARRRASALLARWFADSRGGEAS